MKSEDMWKCSACGCDNRSEWDKCLQCKMPRHESTVSESKLAGNQWLCPTCKIPVKWGSKCPQCDQEEKAALQFARAAADRVTITGLDIPFVTLVGFMIKLSLAAIPAMFVVAIIYSLGAAMLGGLFLVGR